MPILAVTLTGGGYDDYALRRIAERFVEGLTSLKDVSTSYVYDGRTREFEVTMDPKKLASFGIPAEAVRLALKPRISRRRLDQKPLRIPAARFATTAL